MAEAGEKTPLSAPTPFLCWPVPSSGDAALPVFLGACVLSRFTCALLCVTLWTVACQAPLSMGFSRKESWSGLPCPPPGNLPDPGIEPRSLASPALVDGFFTTSATWEAAYVLLSQNKVDLIFNSES